MGPVQGTRTQLTQGAADAETGTAMDIAIRNRQADVNVTTCSLLLPNLAPKGVHAKEIEVVKAQAAGNLRDAESGKGANEPALLPVRDSQSGQGVVLRQSVHVDPQPRGGCQAIGVNYDLSSSS